MSFNRNHQSQIGNGINKLTNKIVKFDDQIFILL